MAVNHEYTLPFQYSTFGPELPCSGSPRATRHQGKQAQAAGPVRYSHALSRVLALVLPLLIVMLVAVAVVAATANSSRRQEYHGTHLDNNNEDFTEEDSGLLIGSGGLSRVAPAETFKPRRMVHTDIPVPQTSTPKGCDGSRRCGKPRAAIDSDDVDFDTGDTLTSSHQGQGRKSIAANGTGQTPEITINTRTRRHGGIEFEPPSRPRETRTTGTLPTLVPPTSSAIDNLPSSSPPKPHADLSDAMRVSIQDLLSSMEAASLTPSQRKEIVRQTPSIANPLRSVTPDAWTTVFRAKVAEGGHTAAGSEEDNGSFDDDESTRGFKEGLDLKEEPDFRKEHDEPPGRLQFRPARNPRGVTISPHDARGRALTAAPSAANPPSAASPLGDPRATVAV